MNVPITTEYIKLDQFLKLSQIVGSGGEARLFIFENDIFVNNEKENRRGRKLRPGDFVMVLGKEYHITQAGESK